MMFAFAPIVAPLLDVSDIAVSLETLLLSVGPYFLILLAAGALTCRWLLSHADRTKRGDRTVTRYMVGIKPFSVISLPATVVLYPVFKGGLSLNSRR